MFWKGVPRMMGAVACVAILLALIFIGEGQSEVAVGAIGGAVGFLLFVLVARYSMFEQFFKNPKNARTFNSVRSFRFDVNGLEAQMDTGIRTTAPWTALVGAQRRKGFLLLGLSASQDFMVPLHAFASEDDEALVWATLVRQGLATDKKR